MLENLKIGFIILLTGIAIVFFVLILLIGIIKLYSTIVYNIQNSNKKEKKEKSKKEAVVEAAPVVEKVTTEKAKPSDGTVPGEIVAAIAAAVEVIFGQGAVKIKSIKKSSKTSKRRSAWKSAGVAENTRSF